MCYNMQYIHIDSQIYLCKQKLEITDKSILNKDFEERLENVLL